MFLLIIGIILICTYVKTPVSISTASCGCLDQFYVNRHKIIDVHPASSVSSGLSVKRTLGVVDDLITEQRHQLALCPSGSLSRSIHSTRAAQQQGSTSPETRRARSPSYMTKIIQKNGIWVISVGFPSDVEAANFITNLGRPDMARQSPESAAEVFVTLPADYKVETKGKHPRIRISGTDNDANNDAKAWLSDTGLEPCFQREKRTLFLKNPEAKPLNAGQAQANPAQGGGTGMGTREERSPHRVRRKTGSSRGRLEKLLDKSKRLVHLQPVREDRGQ